MATRKITNQQTPKSTDALIVEKASFTAKLLDRIELGKVLINQRVTNIQELENNEKEFYKWDSYNSEYLKNSFNNENNKYKKEYDMVNSSFILTGGPDNPSEKLKELKEDIKNKVDNLESLVERVEILKSEVESSKPKQSKTTNEITDVKNIFIVHGHNNSALQSVARTIEKLGLNPVILHEQPNEGKTIIEKFESHSNVGFAIVLLTDDDDGKSKTEIDLKSRARQNVVLELGYFIGRLGRSKVLPFLVKELNSQVTYMVYFMFL